MRFNAVITAGGRVDGAYARAIGTQVKALATVRGSTMLERAIDAARAAGAARVAVVGGDEIRAVAAARVEKIVPEGASGSQNVYAALHAWPLDEPLLYLTSDMPYVHAAALRDFMTRVPPGTLALPLVEEADYERRFPGAPAHGLVLAGERITNGGAFVIPAGAVSIVETFATRFFDARKSLFSMARLLGFVLLAEFALRRLTISRLENHALRLLGIDAFAVRNSAPELAFDCDTLADLEYARQRP
ncbi:MAG: NTP transferase domain-containing protein [Vulcanimicrobiaceae bacterium]